jgi:predicted nucleotidyltransferase
MTLSLHSSTIADALFTNTQQQVLGLLYGRPEQSFYLNEIVRLAGMGKGTVKRELDKLTSAGLLQLSKQGNQRHYQANTHNPIFSELNRLVQKTMGLSDPLKTALMPLASQLEIAFIYGSMAKGTAHAASDIDLMLVGEGITYSEVMECLLPAEQILGRKINPTIYSLKEFTQKQTTQQSFITRVWQQEKLWLFGEDNNSE